MKHPKEVYPLIAIVSSVLAGGATFASYKLINQIDTRVLKERTERNELKLLNNNIHYFIRN
jgi:hypothetical protein